MDSTLSGKRVLLGVTGGIAAYKSLQIVRDLTAARVAVQVVLTPTARRFVPPLTLQVFSGRPVLSRLFDPHDHVLHLTLAQETDLILVAPATAHFLAKMVMGLADDLLGNVLLAAQTPVLVAPAMDLGMWAHPAVQKNVATLRERGIVIIEPVAGPLASGSVGVGRLADEQVIFQAVASVLSASDALGGETVVVTAGPTQEPIDPVRYLSNRSSGKMGYAVAQAARQSGARVVLISGPTALPCPAGVERLWVRTAAEMRKALDAHFMEATMVVMAAAVGDYRPTSFSDQKTKKTGRAISLHLEETEDILKGLPADRGDRVVVGFAAETQDLTENAKKKRREKRLDLIVANDVTQEGAGFEGDTNIAHLIDCNDQVTALPKMPKLELAQRLLQEAYRIRRRLQEGGLAERAK